MRILRKGPLRSPRSSPQALERKALAEVRAVEKRGDQALGREGQVGRAPLQVEPSSLRRAFNRLTPRNRAALEAACRHLGALARRELASLREFDLRPTQGLTVFHRRVPLGRVGLLVPPGRVSPLLQIAIPAAVAGVPERALCAAPGPDGTIDENLLAAAYMCEIKEIYAVGGARAVAALAYGTATIRPVQRILGSGDLSVRLAKRAVASHLSVDEGDFPTELLVLADDTASAELVAADLLAQAELDSEADCALVTTSEAVAHRVQAELRLRAKALSPDDPARGPISRARVLVASDMQSAVAHVNDYAPQRLSLQVVRPDDLVGSLRGYGALFVGAQSPACLAEYVGGGRAAPSGGPGRGQGVLDLASLRPPVVALQVDPSAYLRLSRVAATLADLDGRRHARRAMDIRVFKPAQGR
ncbi:MAG: histidinol dehydrogenase [Polyangia bacterium]|jgi:histidinol dehydrogenase|nr:histidinol dehydrogenase [Polyangia bacterium]